MHRYDYNPMARKMYTILDEYNELFTKVLVDIQEGRRIMMVFRSKKCMNRTLAALQAAAPFKFTTFDGDSSSEHMKNFQNIDDYIIKSNAQVIAFTSKVKNICM